MKKLFWTALAIAVTAAFFASTHPDGLDFISEQFGFAEKGQERTAPMADYSIGLLPEGGISTSTAGIAGILITLGVFWLAAYLMKKGNNKMHSKAACLVLLIGLMVSPALAARPLVTDDYGTVDPGKYELEVGYNYSTPKAGGASATGFGVQLKRGIASNFDLGIEAPFSFIPDACLGDTVLHAKLQINEGLTGRVDLKLCNADPSAGIGSGYYDQTVMVIYSKEIAGFRTHYNLGYTLVGVPNGAPNANTINYSTALEKEVKPGVDVVTEYFAVASPSGTTSNVLVGGRWQALEAISLDAGCSLALNDNSDNVATVGLTAGF